MRASGKTIFSGLDSVGRSLASLPRFAPLLVFAGFFVAFFAATLAAPVRAFAPPVLDVLRLLLASAMSVTRVLVESRSLSARSPMSLSQRTALSEGWRRRAWRPM